MCDFASVDATNRIAARIRFAVSPDLPSGVCVHGLPGEALSLWDLWLDLSNPWITDKLGEVLMQKLKSPFLFLPSIVS
jgi:hypothetical protein